MSLYLAFDIESSLGIGVHGPSWKDPNNDFYSVNYGTHPDKPYVLHNIDGFKRRLPPEVCEILERMPIIVGTNLKFDLGYIWHDPSFQRWLSRGGEIWDIQIAHYLMSAQRHSFPSLAEMQRLVLGIQTKSDRISGLFKRGVSPQQIIQRRNENKGWWKVYEHYCKEDVRTPLLIMQKQHKKAKAMGMLPIIKLYNQYLLALCMIEVNGLTINIPQAEITYQEFSLKVVDHLRDATKLVEHLWTDKRLPVFNVNSGPHSSAILFGGDITCDVRQFKGMTKGKKPGYNKVKYIDNLGEEKIEKIQHNGIEPKEKWTTVKEVVHVKGIGLDPLGLTSRTKTGCYQTGEEVVNAIYVKTDNKLAKDYCKLLKLSATYKQKISTYLNAFLYKSVDGVVRPNYNNTETSTGRLSCSAPNAQNMPSKGEFRYSIQGLVIAPKGWVCCSIDFSQLETYCRALLTREPNLVRDLIDGKDFHIQNMCWGYGITYEEGYQLAKIDEEPIWKARRSDAKAVTFGEAYGQMPESMSVRTGIPLDVVKSMYEQMYINYPGLADYDKKVSSEVSSRAVIGLKSDLPAKMTRGTVGKKGMRRMFNGNMELLPIRQLDKKTYKFDYNEPRHVGFYTSLTGRMYAFEERAAMTKRGDIFKYFHTPEMKNYMMQGLAGDIQALTTVELFPYLLANADKVKIVNEIHDSKWFIIKKEHVDLIVPKLCAIITSVSVLLKERFNIDVDFQFKADAETGDNFAEMTSYKLD